MADKGISQREQRGRATTEPATLTIAFGKETDGKWDFTFFIEKKNTRDMANTYSRYEDVFGETLDSAERKLTDLINDAKKYVKLTEVVLSWKDGHIFRSPDEAIQAYFKEGGNVFRSGLSNYMQAKKGETSIWTQFSFSPELLRTLKIKVSEEKRKQLRSLDSPVRKIKEVGVTGIRRIGGKMAPTSRLGFTPQKRIGKSKSKAIPKQKKEEIAKPTELPRLPHPDEDVLKRLQEGVSKRRLLK
jgi:hypothetical protein